MRWTDEKVKEFCAIYCGNKWYYEFTNEKGIDKKMIKYKQLKKQGVL